MKMKKLVALFTAAALCLGMSMTAFAATDNSRTDLPTAIGSDVAGNGYSVQNSASETDLRKIATAAEAALVAQLAVPVTADVKVIAVGDYSLYDENGKLVTDGIVPGGNQKFYFDIPAGESTKGYYHGAPIYVTHELKSSPGQWEVIQGQLVWTKDGVWKMEVSMNEFSPVAFFKVMSDGSIIEVKYENGKAVPKEQGKAAGAAGAKTSPKTGE